MLCTVGSIVENDFANLRPEVIRSKTLCRGVMHVLRFFSLFVFLLAIFRFELIICMLFDLPLDDFLHEMSLVVCSPTWKRTY